MRLSALVLLLVLSAPPLAAHELSSGALWLDELAGGEVTARLKSPLARDGTPVALVPQFSTDCAAEGAARVTREERFVVRDWRLRCAKGLAGQDVRIDGLDPRTPDAVVIARFADGTVLTVSVDRRDPVARFHRDDGASLRLRAYLPLGVEHIWLGADHLLFVLGLMLVVAARAGRHPGRTLVATITAFTLAHSLTLALAALGLWGLPASVVEVLIAASILLLALELAGRERRRARELPDRLTLRKPWIVAFAFGLLHGFGFAGALAEIGLPEEARGWALLLFNLGVEIGQLLFVATALLVLAALRRLRVSLPRLRGMVGEGAVAGWSVLLLGGTAAYWTLDRLAVWAAHLQVLA